MKIVRGALIVFLTFSTCPHITSQSAKIDAAKQGDSFATRQEFSKGGIGMVNKHLYVIVRSARNERNELIVKPTEETEARWYGKSATQTEAVIFFDGKIYSSSQNLPADFDLSKSVLVSFESEKVRFFDFQSMYGAYYKRIHD